MLCESCDTIYPISNDRPVLIRPDNTIFCPDDYRILASPNCSRGIGRWTRYIPDASTNLSSDRVFSRLQTLFGAMDSATVLVVGGGRQRAWLDKYLRTGDSMRVVYSDVDVAADVDLFCDAHDLPFVDDAFDGVVTTAVLEHVMYPERVASEILRVLKTGGLLYSELPFMQQVHEGAYDFTRYTLSGHRRLFNRVAEIESGMVAGPGTALVWAIENFVLAFVSRSLVRNVCKGFVRLTIGWLKYLDKLLAHRPAAMDGASCTYLLGRKIDGQISDADIIASYVGSKHLRHT